MTSAVSITWKNECSHGKQFHLARHRLPPAARIGAHRHDFDECFWIEAGGGVHLTAGGSTPLAPGDAACLRAADVHAVRAGPEGLVLLNVSFPCRSGAALASGRALPWPWRPGGPPRHRRLDPQAMERLHGWIGELSRPDAGRAELDAFLLDFVRLVARDAGRPGQPPHLSAACAAFTDPVQLAGGTVALSRLCGCGPAHLNRLCRRWHGCTASELVARIRLDWASRELRLTARPIGDIAVSSGMPHLGHFYRRFRARFGVTPKRWRDAAWGLFAPTATALPASAP
jgi:AraC-like DNA-binding protein/quercetin dioxygenase-like cupin family protein